MLELHCHTTYSDGMLTPGQLVRAAVEAGVQGLAITDHDTLAGWNDAQTAAQPYGLEIVPGVELSTVYQGRLSRRGNGFASLHVLGYYPDPAQLREPLQLRIEGRRRRARQMIENLADLGYPVALPDLDQRNAPGRPHVAAALVAAGHVKTAREAFDRFLAEGQPAYVHYDRFTAVEGVALLRSCGAVPVWAHPYLFRGGDVEGVLKDLVDAGLMGVEVYHPGHTPSQIRTLERLAQQFSLLVTGGSDFHGPTPDTKGRHATVLNTLKLPMRLLEPIKQAANDLKH